MTNSPNKGWVRQAGLYGLFIGVVIVLTVLFSFLGTISCAMLAGMIMAAGKVRLGQAIFGSVVFPLVVIAMVQFSRADLASRQSFWLAALCFGTFWLAYCLTLLVTVLERPSGSQAEGKPLPAAAPSAAGEARGEVTRGAEPPLGDPRDGNRWAAETVFTLEALQGRWWWEGAEAELRPWKKVVEITGDKFTFSVVSSPDCRQVVACGEVSLEVGSCRRLRLSADDALGISI